MRSSETIKTLAAALSAPIDPSRVATRDGRSYLEGWDVIATLNRIFGFDGWSKDVQALELCFEVGETKPGRNGGSYMAWTVAYRAAVCLTIHADDARTNTHADVSVGTATNQPSRADAHDLAAKSAVTDALKRCAKDLGDQFGLSLYNKGSLAPTGHSQGQDRSEPAQRPPQASQSFGRAVGSRIDTSTGEVTPPDPVAQVERIRANTQGKNRKPYDWCNGGQPPAHVQENNKPSEPQMKRYFAICKSAKIDPNDACSAMFPGSGPKSITWKEYNYLTNAIEDGWRPEQEPVTDRAETPRGGPHNYDDQIPNETPF